MTHSTYTPGRWTAVLTDGFAALLDPAAAQETADGLWEQAAAGGSFVDGLSVLSRGGFGAMPVFALAVRAADGRTNVAVRGEVEVVAVCADQTVSILGAGVSTWVERVLSDVRQLHFSAPGEAAGPVLPLVAGVVQAGGLRTPATAEGEPAATWSIAVGTAEGTGPGGAELAVASAQDDAVESGPGAQEPAELPVGSAAGPVDEAPVARPEPAQTEPAQTEPAESSPPVATAPAVPADGSSVPGELVPAAPTDSWSVPGEPVPTSAGDVGRPTPWSGDPDAPAAPELSEAMRQPVTVGAHARPDAGAESDGAAFTILSSRLADLREGLPAWGDRHEPEPVEPLPAPSRTTARLVLSTGLVVALDRPVLLGRAPQALRVSGRELPRLVAVPSPQQDISRTHAEVRVEGEDVLVTDLDSTNGVHVLQPGRGARRLRPSEPRALRADETIDLGDGVTFIVERGT